MGNSPLSYKGLIQAQIPFTNNTHEPVAFVCWEESITHNAKWTSHSTLTIGAKEMLLQSWASVWCANTTHFVLGLRSVCQRNFCLDYSDCIIFKADYYCLVFSRIMMFGTAMLLLRFDTDYMSLIENTRFNAVYHDTRLWSTTIVVAILSLKIVGPKTTTGTEWLECVYKL